MATSAQVDEGALIRHSFDVVHFPMYLDRNGFTRVRFETTEVSDAGDLIGYFTDEARSRVGVYVKLITDPDGVSVTTDQFFLDLHDLFQKLYASGRPTSALRVLANRSMHLCFLWSCCTKNMGVAYTNRATSFLHLAH